MELCSIALIKLKLNSFIKIYIQISIDIIIVVSRYYVMITSEWFMLWYDDSAVEGSYLLSKSFFVVF
jgi:hypothetical protein